MTRYVEAQRRYFSECEPWAQAGLVVDNADVERPALRSNGSWAR
jgi:uridine kinase